MMALTIEQNVTIDVLNPRRNIIHVVQEDSTRVIRLTLLANNLPYNVEATETETVLKFVEFLKADGHGGMYDTTSTGETAVQLEDSNVPNVWLIALDGQCFTFPGWTQINIRFETESGRRLHTFPIFVDVSPTASSDTESTDWGELNSIADLRNAVGALFEATMSADAKQALLNLLSHVAYADEHGQDYYDELEAALFQTAEIVSISAVFDQGSAVIYDTDDLDTLKQYLTVTATYEDLSTREITGYTLSGTLTEGTSTITVTYGGKTATFDVTVTADHRIYLNQGEFTFSDGSKITVGPRNHIIVYNGSLSSKMINASSLNNNTSTVTNAANVNDQTTEFLTLHSGNVLTVTAKNATTDATFGSSAAQPNVSINIRKKSATTSVLTNAVQLYPRTSNLHPVQTDDTVIENISEDVIGSCVLVFVGYSYTVGSTVEFDLEISVE